jgi:hypothetical protein
MLHAQIAAGITAEIKEASFNEKGQINYGFTRGRSQEEIAQLTGMMGERGGFRDLIMMQPGQGGMQIRPDAIRRSRERVGDMLKSLESVQEMFDDPDMVSQFQKLERLGMRPGKMNPRDIALGMESMKQLGNSLGLSTQETGALALRTADLLSDVGLGRSSELNRQTISIAAGALPFAPGRTLDEMTQNVAVATAQFSATPIGKRVGILTSLMPTMDPATLARFKLAQQGGDVNTINQIWGEQASSIPGLNTELDRIASGADVVPEALKADYQKTEFRIARAQKFDELGQNFMGVLEARHPGENVAPEDRAGIIATYDTYRNIITKGETDPAGIATWAGTAAASELNETIDNPGYKTGSDAKAGEVLKERDKNFDTSKIPTKEVAAQAALGGESKGFWASLWSDAAFNGMDTNAANKTPGQLLDAQKVAEHKKAQEGAEGKPSAGGQGITAQILDYGGHPIGRIQFKGGVLNLGR